MSDPETTARTVERVQKPLKEAQVKRNTTSQLDTFPHFTLSINKIIGTSTQNLPPSQLRNPLTYNHNMDEHFEASCALRHLTSEQQEQVKGLSDTLQESLVATATLCRTEDCFGCNPPDESEPRGPAIPVTKRLVPLYEVEVLSSLFNNPLNDDPNDQHSTTWEWRVSP